MIRKNLLLTLLMALFVPLAAWAQIVPTNLECLLNPTDPTVAYMKWWAPTGYESSWLLQFSTRDDFPDNPNYTWTRYVYNVPQYRLTGLTPETTYYVRVKDRAGSGSQYSNTFTFTPKVGHQIGEIGTFTPHLPCNSNYVGGFSVQAYDKNTVQKGKINKIFFYCSDNVVNVSRKIKIYLSDGQSRFYSWAYNYLSYVTDSYDLLCLEDGPAKLVYEGTKTFNPGWNEITFNKISSYDYSEPDSKSKGLFVFFVDETGEATTLPLFFGVHSSQMWGGLYEHGDISFLNWSNYFQHGGAQIHSYQDSWVLRNGYFEYNQTTAQIPLNETGLVNTIRLGYSDVVGFDVSVSAKTPNVTGEGTARLSWSGSNAQHYVLQYGTSSSFASNLTTTKYLYDESFDLSNLSPTQTYHWRVKAVGAFNETDWRVGISFKPTKQVAIGSGTATNFYLPFNSNYKYYLSQQIYTASEMTKAGIVESVTFECSTLSNPETRNLDIYMVHTDKTQFDSKSDWVPVTPDDLVFSGPVTFNNGLNRISFNSGFEYDGQRNVVLVVDDNTGEYGATPNFAVFTTPNLNQSITYGNSFNNVDVQNTSGFSQYSVDLYSTKNRVTFEINTPSGMNKPTGLVATLNPDTPTEATLGWTENGTATRWDVRYGTDPSFADCQTMEVSDTPQAQLTGLTPETTYYAQVRSLKNSSSAWSAPIAFVPTDKIVVGAGEAISSSLPIRGIITCISQQIYTADELLNEPRLIESVSFYCENITFTRSSVGINLMHTDKEVFDNTDDMMSIDNGVTVFNGEVTFVAGEWTTINFTTPFAYDGTSNVALTVADFSGSQSLGGFPNFKAFETGRNQALWWVQDTGSPMTQLSTKKNQVRWGCSAVCEAIYHHPEQVGYSPGNSAAVWWFEMGEATEWTVQHGPNAGFPEGSYTEQNVTGEPHIELKNLTPNSVGEYYVRVRSVCGEGFHSFWSDMITLRPEASNEICDGGASSTDILPTIPNQYKYYLSQQIYTRQELRNMPCAIGSVEFNWESTAFPVRNLDIYMVHTDKTQFDSKTDWVQVTADDLVFSGDTDFGYSTITFNKRFMYDGTSNVVLVVNDKTGATDANASEFYSVFETENNQALYAGSNYGNVNPLGDLSAADGIVNIKNCVTFGWEENPILKPTMHDPTLTPNNATVATLSWTENGAATEWVLQYAASDEYGYNFEELLGEITVTGTPTFNLTGLTPWTWYQARVKAIYREGDAEYHSDWSQTAMFQTDQKIEVGTEAQVHGMPMPTHVHNNYSLSQQIYTKDELLNKSCIIRSVDFMKMYGPASRKLKVYMVHTDKDVFENGNDWLTVTADNLVFDGYADFQVDRWSTITFDTPFEYNGTSNVALVVYDETGETTTEHYAFKCFLVSGIKAIGMTSSSIIDPLSANPGNASFFNGAKNMVRFGWEDLGYVIVSPGHPYEFGFETAGDNWTAGEWNVEYTTTPHSGEQCAYMSNAAVSELVSPEIHFDESCDNIVVRFWMKGSGRLMAHYGENLERETLIVNFSNNYNNWTKQEISLSRFMASQTVKALKIGFRNDYPSNTSKEMWIDDFEVVANAYDKVFDPGAQSKQWSAAEHWYPHNVPTSSDNVLIGGSALVGSVDGSNTYTASANTIGFGTQLGYLRVYQGSILEAAQINYRASNNVNIYDGGQLKVGSTCYAQVFKRFIGYDNANSTDHWYLFANPTRGTGNPPSGLITGEYDLYSFDGTANLEWLNYKNHSFKMSNGKGYLYAHAKPTTGSNDYTEVGFAGTVNAANADQTVTGLTYGENTEANPFYNWNLVGNPYPCNAYLSGNRAFYRLEETAEGSRIVLAEDNVIKPMEGVFVQAATSAESSVTFTTTEPTRSNGLNFTMSKKSVTRGAESVIIDRASIRFGEGSGMGHLDLMADANRLYIPQGGKDMAVVCSEPAGEMPLNFEAAENGTYTLGISLNDTELVYCHLIDNLTGADVDLLATSTGSVAEYTFEAKTTDYRSRFKVVFVAKSAFEGDNANNFAFHNGSAWVINASADATVQVIDMTGRVVVSTDVARGVSTNGIAPGVYVMRLIDGNDVKTQKIVVE